MEEQAENTCETHATSTKSDEMIAMLVIRAEMSPSVFVRGCGCPWRNEEAILRYMVDFIHIMKEVSHVKTSELPLQCRVKWIDATSCSLVEKSKQNLPCHMFLSGLLLLSESILRRLVFLLQLSAVCWKLWK